MNRIGLLALLALAWLTPAWAGDPPRSYSIEDMNRLLAQERLLARPATGSADWLVGECQRGGEDYSHCTGLLGGMMLMQDTIRLWYPDAIILCIPVEAGVEQLRLVFLKWAAKYPEHLHQPAPLAVVAAWREAFPCE